MRLGARLSLAAAAMLLGSPLAAQSYPPPEDQTARSVPPAPPPERRAPPPFPSFSSTPPKPVRTHVASRPKAAPKARHIVVEKRTKVGKALAREEQRPTSRERKDQRWCATLTKKQLGRNAKCRKVLDKQQSVKSVAKPAPALTKLDRKDERRCGKLSLNQVLRDPRCRKVAERQLSSKPVRESSKATSHRAKAKAVTKSRPAKKRSRR